MKTLSKWSLRLTATALLIVVLLLSIILNPGITYAHSVKINNFTVYSQEPIPKLLISKLNDVAVLMKSSELYNKESHFDICMNDGAVYPLIMQKLRSPAFAWGFYDKVVLQGNASYKENVVELNGYKWNLTQLLTHELIHCMQFNYYGLFKSNPIAGIPEWKWEGYAEYIARKQEGGESLITNIDRLIKSNKIDSESWEIVLSDNTISPRVYYNYFLLIKYGIEVKKWSYNNILNNQVTEVELSKEMMLWYHDKKNMN